MSDWTNEQETIYQEVKQRAQELEAQRSAALGARQAATETVAITVAEGMNLSGEECATLATSMRKYASAVRAALKPYDQSEVQS